MRLAGYVLELADGTVVHVPQSAQSGYPEIKATDVPRFNVAPFTAANPPKGEQVQQTNRRELSQPA